MEITIESPYGESRKVLDETRDAGYNVIERLREYDGQFGFHFDTLDCYHGIDGYACTASCTLDGDTIVLSFTGNDAAETVARTGNALYNLVRTVRDELLGLA